MSLPDPKNPPYLREESPATMPKPSLIYLDMDGVCCDFFAAATRINGYDPSTVFATWAQHHRGEFYLYKVLGIDSDTFWDHIAEGGETLWRELGEYPWFAHMYGELKKLGRVVFLSASTRHPSCPAGKLHWLQDRFGTAFNEFIFTSHKDLLAHAGAVLIDDYEPNINAFQARDGGTILFPRLWNALHHVDTDPGTHVLRRCQQWLRSR